MIKTKQDYKYFLEADRIALGIPKKRDLLSFCKELILPNEVWRFQKTLRKLEYYTNCKHNIFAFIYRVFIIKKFHKLSRKLNFTIPINVFDAGLNIAHPGTIIINPTVRIGKNCRIHACTNIGTQAGHLDETPVIGDNCYIAPGVKIYGKIIIANGIAIGSNAVVNKSFTEENIAIAGVPAKKIGESDTRKLLRPATEMMNSNKTNIN